MVVLLPPCEDRRGWFRAMEVRDPFEVRVEIEGPLVLPSSSSSRGDRSRTGAPEDKEGRGEHCAGQDDEECTEDHALESASALSFVRGGGEWPH